MTLSAIQTVRLLIGEQVSPAFSDDEIQTFLDLQSSLAGSNDQFYMAAYLGLRSLAARLLVLGRAGGSRIKIGDFESGIEVGALWKAFVDQAQGYLELVRNTPAFAIAEDDVSEFAQLQIIRNWISRTQL